MGLDSYLKTLASALLGQSQQQPVPPQPQGVSSSPSTAAPPPQQAGFMQGAASLIGNPLTQAALGGYFNAIGTPKMQGRGARFANAGLGAMNAFNAAEQAQSQAPLNAAKIAGMQQQNALTGAQAGLTSAKTQQIAGIPAANAALAAQIHAAIPSMTPTQAQRATVIANTIATDTSKVYDPKEAFTAIYQEPLKEAQIQAQTGATAATTKKTEAETGAIPSEIALRNAEAGHVGAETAAIPARTALETAEAGAIPARTDLTKAETAAIPERLKLEGERASAAGSGKDIANWYDPITGEQYRGAQKKPTDKLVSTIPKTPKAEDPVARAAKVANIRKDLGKEYDDSLSMYAKHTMSTADYLLNKENYINGKMASMGLSGGAHPEVGDPLALIPSGKVPAMKGDVHGYANPDGSGFTSLE